MSTGAGVRLAGSDGTEWSAELRGVLEAAFAYARAASSAGVDAGAPEDDAVPTLTLLAHQPHLVAPFLGWAGALAATGTLPRADAELVALRTAWRCRSAFEWREHRNYALVAGLTPEEIDAVAGEPAALEWSPRHRALLRAADDLHDHATILPATWSELRAECRDAEIVEVVLVSGQYRMLSALVNAAGSDASLTPPAPIDRVAIRIDGDIAGAPWRGSD